MSHPKRDEIIRLKQQGLSYWEIDGDLELSRGSAMRILRPMPNALKKAKERSNGHCENCGKQSKLHGHHPDYNDPDMVVMLCATCHGKSHIPGKHGRRRLRPGDKVKLNFALTPKLKLEVMEASKDKRGGLSQVIRELLIEWLAKRRGKEKSK